MCSMDENALRENAASSDSSSTGEEERLKQLFLSCDSDKDGRLDCYDLYEMCSRLRMEDHAEEIINILGAREKENISLQEFLSCRKKVFLESVGCVKETDNCVCAEKQLRCSQMGVYNNPRLYTQENSADCANNNSVPLADKQPIIRNCDRRLRGRKPDGVNSDGSPVNSCESGAEYDSGAQDLSDDPQDLQTLLHRKYPELYSVIFPTSSVSLSDVMANGSSEVRKTTQPIQRTNGSLDPSSLKTVSTMIPEMEWEKASQTLVSPSIELAQRLFECMNLLHLQRTARLQSEVRDLSHRIRGLQLDHESVYRDWQRVERERDQLRHELSNQIARYEDRLTELHSVIAELRRRLEHTGTNTIPEADEFEEADDDDNGHMRLCERNEIDRPEHPTCYTVPSLSRERESLSHAEPHSDRSSDGGTSVGAIDGDLMDRCAFHTRPDRFVNHLDLCSSTGDLAQLSDVLICGQYEPFQSTRPNVPIQQVITGRTSSDTDLHFAQPQSGSAKTAAVTKTTTPTTQSNTENRAQCVNSALAAALSPEEMITDYRDTVSRLRNELERVARERDRLAQLVRSGNHTVPCTINQPEHSDVTAQSSPASRPCMGLGQRIAQSKLGGSMDSTSFGQGIPSEVAVRTGSLGSCPTQSKISNSKHEYESGDEAHVYDLPEPEWVSTSLKYYHEKTTAPESNQPEIHPHTTNNLTTPLRSNVSNPENLARSSTGGAVTESADFIFDGTGETDSESALTGPLSPRALTALLHSLAQRVPYPRLGEALHCAQITWEYVLATLARYRSDCIVLQANLAEAKSHSDRMQCQLNQIEANWSGAMRAACLADASLEIVDCLNQLYATELAIMLYRQTKKSFTAAQAFSTLSSSTSSSSFPRRGKSVQIACPFPPSGNGLSTGRARQSSNPSSSSAHPASPHHPYAIYAVPGYAGTECDIPTGNTAPVMTQFTLNLRTLRSFRYQAELSAQSLLERYEQMDSNNQDRFYPTVSSSSTGGGVVGGVGGGGGGGGSGGVGNVGITSASLNRGFTRNQNPGPVSPALLSIHSPLGPPVPSTQSLTGSSVYANSWYISLGRLGRANGPVATAEQTSIGSGLGSGYLVNQTKLSNLNLPLGRASTKLVPHPNPAGVGAGGAGGGGWQTPDSGAGSSSTHEVTQPTLFHTVFPSGLIELSTYEAVLDLMPSILMHTGLRHDIGEHSFCDSDSDSSDSSDGDLAAVTTTQTAVTASGASNIAPTSATANNTSSSTPIPLTTGWSRTDERKLRILLHQLVHSRRVLRSTIVEQLPHINDDDGLSDGQLSVTRESFPCISTGSLGKRSLNVLLESSILLQELCSVKEERADLKARVYLLEKELHANRLTLESRTAAENALRAHLDALRLSSQDNTRHSRSEEQRDGRVSNVGSAQSEALLRAQVKNLLQALESLRHSSELQQIQNEELVDDLKRANTALIAAFEKAKRKYLSRIKKLEDQMSQGTNLTRPNRLTCTRPLRRISEPEHPASKIPTTGSEGDCFRTQPPAPMSDRPLPPVMMDQATGGRTSSGKMYRQNEHHHGPLPPPPTTATSHMQTGSSSNQTRSTVLVGTNSLNVNRAAPMIPRAPERTNATQRPTISHSSHAPSPGEFHPSPCRTERAVATVSTHRAT